MKKYSKELIILFFDMRSSFANAEYKAMKSVENIDLDKLFL